MGEKRITKAHEDCVTPIPKIDSYEPRFDAVDNLGDRNSFYFRPKFKNKRMKQSTLDFFPTGCIHVPNDDESKRNVDYWKFVFKS